MIQIATLNSRTYVCTYDHTGTRLRWTGTHVEILFVEIVRFCEEVWISDPLIHEESFLLGYLPRLLVHPVRLLQELDESVPYVANHLLCRLLHTKKNECVAAQ